MGWFVSFFLVFLAFVEPISAFLCHKNGYLSKSSTSLFSYGEQNFMESLRSRVSQADTLPVVIQRDSVLPRQVLTLKINDPVHLNMIQERYQEDNPYFGMVGISPRNLPLEYGVEVEILGIEFLNHSPGGVNVQVRGNRRFRVKGSISKQNEKQMEWTQRAKVDFLSSDEEENSEDDTIMKECAMQQAREFSTPNPDLQESSTMVEKWISLARKENYPVDKILEDIGPMPHWSQPSECAYWVGSLINDPRLGKCSDLRLLVG